MAIIKAVSSHAPLNTIVNYVEKDEKVKNRLISGKDCSPDTALDEMQSTKELYGKTGGRTYAHYVQSFAPGENITAEEAHQIAREFAEQCEAWKGYEVLIATHEDREHIHTHFIVNSVSFENGHKYQLSRKGLQEMKDMSDDLCRSHGLSICEKGRSFDGTERTSLVAWTKEKYQYLQGCFAQKADKSYLIDTNEAVRSCANQARSKDEFVDLMSRRGYTVDWNDRRKNITFTDEEGHKVRGANLEKTFGLGADKDTLLAKFDENSRACYGDFEKRMKQLRTREIVREYEIGATRDAKHAIDRKLSERREDVTALQDILDQSASGIKSARERIIELEEMRNDSGFSLLKKHEFDVEIAQKQALVEGIQHDRDDYLRIHGFESVKDAREYVRDFCETEEYSCRLGEQLDRFEKAKNEDQLEYAALANGSHILSDEDRLECQDPAYEELKQRFGDMMDDDTFGEAIRQTAEWERQAMQLDLEGLNLEDLKLEGLGNEQKLEMPSRSQGVHLGRS